MHPVSDSTSDRLSVAVPARLAEPPAGATLHGVLMETAPDAIISIDESSTILSVNVAAERLFEYTSKEMLGQPLEMLMPERLRAMHDAGLGHYLATGERRISWHAVRLPILTKSGREVPTSISFGEFESNGRRLFSGFVRDITDIVNGERAMANANTRLTEQAAALETQAEELKTTVASLVERTREAERAREETERAHDLAETARQAAEQAQQISEEALRVAEQASHAKDAFVAKMSHELRTPLNAIGGYAEILELGIHGPVTDSQREALIRIQRSQRHLLSLVNDVLDFARLGARAMDLQMVDVSIEEIFADTESLVRPQLNTKHIDYSTYIDHTGTAAIVCGDRDRIVQILVNLVSNSIKFTPPLGRITISYTATGDTATITVSDTGSGIPSSQMERIFKPFTQVQEGLTRTVEGTGLGLTISRDLARAMGGDLKAQQSDIGATIVLTLPRSAQPRNYIESPAS